MTEPASCPPAAVPTPGGRAEPAIDIAHLDRMTLGDPGLARQVLELFDRQAELLMVRMGEIEAHGRASLAHTLCGSARGIGAWRVAEAAEALERAAMQPGQPGLGELGAAVVEARRAIARLIGRAAPA